ncbi:amidase signature domain-containing protein [Aspergillus aurantiobrunneus]
MAEHQTWQALAAERREQLDLLIPAEWRLSEEFKSSLPADGRLLRANPVQKSGILSDAELDITENYSAAQLLQRLAWGEVSSLAVTTAFCKRAANAQQLTSCLTEHFFSQALERARYLDEYLKRKGKVVGPLHGLPISVKDTYRVKGVHATIGYVSFLKNGVAKENSALVNLLLDLGAVLYVKTNLPQTMMTADSDNNIYGRTLNPHNTNLTAGGSSGGEAALVAFRGSILGMATDIAGSIRIPALCCGVYGFKPTANRIPFGGQVTGAAEETPMIEPSAGPLAQTLDDIELFMSSVLNAEPWKYDISAVAAPWNRQAESQSLLTVGILPEDTHFPFHPPVRRALESAIEALKKKGHRIIRLSNDPSRDVAFANRLAFDYFTYGPRPDHVTPSGEPLVISVAKGPSPMFSGPSLLSQDLGVFERISTLSEARKNYRDAWRKTIVDNSLDVILAPGAQNTAVPHDTYGWPPYTAVWNLVDYPACIIPYGKASRELDPGPVLVKGDQPSYDPEAVDGAPCALQIVAPRFQDEKCLAAARVIDRDIRF